jgi:hypothetical protein
MYTNGLTGTSVFLLFIFLTPSAFGESSNRTHSVPVAEIKSPASTQPDADTDC